MAELYTPAEAFFDACLLSEDGSFNEECLLKNVALVTYTAMVLAPSSQEAFYDKLSQAFAHLKVSMDDDPEVKAFLYGPPEVQVEIYQEASSRGAPVVPETR